MYAKILVPLDDSDASARGLSEAIRIAQPGAAQLVLLHVVEDIAWIGGMYTAFNVEQVRTEIGRGADELLAKEKKTAEAKGLEVTSVVRTAVGVSVADVAVDEARKSESELIVMGTHGRKALGRLLMGSDALSVVQHSPVPVLLVRAQSGT